MPKKKSKKTKIIHHQFPKDESSDVKKELVKLQEKRQKLIELETKELKEVKGFKKAGVFAKALVRRGSLNKQINERRKLLGMQTKVKVLRKQKEIAKLKKEIAASKPKPISIEGDILKPIQPIKSEDIFKY